MRKAQGWKPELGDMSFELTSQYFLSGVGGYVPPRGKDGAKVVPPRHGVAHFLSGYCVQAWDDVPPSLWATAAESELVEK